MEDQATGAANADRAGRSGSVCAERGRSTCLSRQSPLELMNHAQGQHAFDVLDAADRSRPIIARTLAFLQGMLKSEN